MMVVAIIPLVFAVPAMIVFHDAMRAFPASCVELLPIVTRTYPKCAFVGRTGPVTVVPPIMATHRIPVAIYIRVTGTG
jgi:hypothetical protein